MEKPDKNVGNFLQNLAKKDNFKGIITEESKGSSKNTNGRVVTTHDLLNEILEKLDELQSNVREIVQEELATLMENATLITEGDENMVQILVGKTHLKGRMSEVVK